MNKKQLIICLAIIFSGMFSLPLFIFAETTKQRRTELTKPSLDMSIRGDFSQLSFSLYEHMGELSNPSFTLQDYMGEFSRPSFKIRSDKAEFSKPGFNIREKSDMEFTTPSFSIYKNRGKNKDEFSRPSFKLRTNPGEFSRPLYQERTGAASKKEHDYEPIKY